MCEATQTQTETDGMELVVFDAVRQLAEFTQAGVIERFVKCGDHTIEFIRDDSAVAKQPLALNLRLSAKCFFKIDKYEFTIYPKSWSITRLFNPSLRYPAHVDPDDVDIPKVLGNQNTSLTFEEILDPANQNRLIADIKRLLDDVDLSLAHARTEVEKLRQEYFSYTGQSSPVLD